MKRKKKHFGAGDVGFHRESGMVGAGWYAGCVERSLCGPLRAWGTKLVLSIHDVRHTSVAGDMKVSR